VNEGGSVDFKCRCWREERRRKEGGKKGVSVDDDVAVQKQTFFLFLFLLFLLFLLFFFFSFSSSFLPR